MPVPAPNLYPAFNVVRVSHAELIVTDLDASRAFYADTLGLQVTFEDTEIICLRAMEERGHHCLILRRGAVPSCSYLAFRLFSEEDIDRAAAFFGGQGRAVEWVERPFQGRTLRVLDPHGVPLEFYFAMERLPTIHQKYTLYRGVKPLRIDHFNCFSPHVDDSVAFYNEIGFRTTEYTEDRETGRLWAAWMHRKGGVHDIAFTNGMGPRLHHVAFWVPTPMNIIDLLDVMATTGYVNSIERGPGRHGIANAF
ncbi:MAG: VOC family protein, partial [Pseudomonadota bacterium]|nr:VOC family protein [Pseudomonadota bacterium]